MSKTRPELSKKNPYHISKYRYYELKYFCLQYPEWKSALSKYDSLAKQGNGMGGRSFNSPTERAAMEREVYLTNMRTVEDACKMTDPVLWSYILEAVTNGYSFSVLRARTGIPCCKNDYYDNYRRFFYILAQK